MSPEDKDKSLLEHRNVSTSAYRVLYILLLLNRHQSLTLLELNLLLLENPLIQRTYNSETITKYINTLRAVGCKIPPANRNTGFQYSLSQTPLPTALSSEAIASLVQLYHLLTAQPYQAELQQQFQSLLRKILWSLPLEQKQLLQEQLYSVNTAQQQKNKALPKLSHELNKLASELTLYCQQRQQLAVEHMAHVNQGFGKHYQYLTVEPQRLLYQGEQVYLVCIDTVKQVKLHLDISSIISVQQLPTRIRSQVKKMTVVFQLVGRLAKAYRPYPNEEVMRGDDPSVLLIRCHTEQPEALLSRLLRYGDHCQIISPDRLRKQVLQWAQRKHQWLLNPQQQWAEEQARLQAEKVKAQEGAKDESDAFSADKKRAGNPKHYYRR